MLMTEGDTQSATVSMETVQKDDGSRTSHFASVGNISSSLALVTLQPGLTRTRWVASGFEIGFYRFLAGLIASGVFFLCGSGHDGERCQKDTLTFEIVTMQIIVNRARVVRDTSSQVANRPSTQ